MTNRKQRDLMDRMAQHNEEFLAGKLDEAGIVPAGGIAEILRLKKQTLQAREMREKWRRQQEAEKERRDRAGEQMARRLHEIASAYQKGALSGRIAQSLGVLSSVLMDWKNKGKTTSASPRRDRSE